MRSELFVEERSYILKELIPLIKELKENKYSMVSPNENIGQIETIADFSLLPDETDLFEL